MTARLPLVIWPLIAALAVQGQMLFNGFLYDDFVHMYTVSNLPLIEAITVPMGGHLLHTFTTVIWAVKSLFGMNPFAFLLIGLLVHLAAVYLLFQILSVLTGRAVLAAFGATLWGINPFAAGALGWISVHGQVLATAAVLWVLLDIARCSQSAGVLRNRILARHVILLLMAVTSFGVGLTSAVVLPLLILLWNPVPGERRRLLAVYGAVALTVVVFYLLTMKLQGHPSDNLDDKVNLVKQGLGNIPMISAAFADLMAIGSSALVLGPLLVGKLSVVSKEALPMVAAMFALFFSLPLLVWGIWVAGSGERRRMLALLLLPCAAYGLIAVARVGGFLTLHAEAPRYHYFSPAILVIVYGLLVSQLLDRLPARTSRDGYLPYFIWLILVIVPFAMGTSPVNSKESRLKRQEEQLARSTRVLEKALDESPGEGDIFIRNRPFSVFVWGYTPESFPGLAGLFVIRYPSNTVDGRRVYFLEESEELVEMARAQRGSRISELLVYKPKGAKPVEKTRQNR